MSTSIQSNCSYSSQPNQLFPGPTRTYDDVGFSPGKPPPATVKRRLEKKIQPLTTKQRCFSSLHVHDSNNNYPANSTLYKNDIKDKNRLMPYIIPTTTKKQALDLKTSTITDGALFGPIPTMDSFAAVFDNKASFLNDDDNAFVTPPMESTNVLMNDDDDNLILDDEMIFQEFELLSNTMNSTTTTSDHNDDTTLLPPSPPLSPFDFFSSFDHQESNDDSVLLEEEQPLDDFVLFP